MFLKITNGVIEYPYPLERVLRDFPNVSFPTPLNEQDLSEFGVFPVAATDPNVVADPLTQKVTEAAPALVNGVWTQQWEVVALTSEEQAAAKQAVLAEFDKALSDHLDATAQSRRYDNRMTCTVRAGYPGQFQAEGIAFAMWMDACNAKAYRILAEVEAGTRPIPASTTELINMMPEMVWPE